MIKKPGNRPLASYYCPSPARRKRAGSLVAPDLRIEGMRDENPNARRFLGSRFGHKPRLGPAQRLPIRTISPGAAIARR
jgi:hypothetical protein